MLTDLDNRSEELGLNGYGISITSLEEVFMKVGAEKNSEHHQDDEIEDSRTNNMITDVESVESKYSVFFIVYHYVIYVIKDKVT